MTSGEVQAAYVGRTHILRLSGDVRLNLCSGFERYLDEILQKPDFDDVVIDLSAADGVDSTTLGQIAKIAIVCADQFDIRPTIYSPNPSITKLLLSMGFDQVFHILDHEFNGEVELKAWACTAIGEEATRERVIAAHKVLMSMNDNNKQLFRELVNTLEADLHQSNG